MAITNLLTETVVLGIVIAIALMVLGIVTLTRLIRSQGGFYLDFKGFGATLRMGRRATDVRVEGSVGRETDAKGREEDKDV